MGDSGSSILQAGAGLFWLSMVLHVITLLCGYGVGAISFAYSGFKSTDVYIVSGSPWTYNSTTGAFYLAYPTDVYNNWVSNSVSGRFLYPQLVQMKDPTTMAVKSFSTSFIFQILINDTSTTQSTGPGLAFLMVPDNVTIGANLDYMGLLTANTTQTSENLQSDNHTLGVEFDTYLNYEFGDPNDNHVGLDLTSMTSSYVFVPSLIMASEDAEIMRQVWIDYDQSDASVDIYIALYGQGKPATPEGSTPGPVDLSFLLEEMYVGFSAAVGIESNNLHTILAWSFSNEGEAPPISIQRDAPTSPGTSPPQGAPPPPIFSPPPPIFSPSPPVFSPPPSLPPSSPPSPQPSVFVPLPGPAPQGAVSSPSSSDPSGAPPPRHSKKQRIIGASVGGILLVIFAGIGIFCYWKFFRRPRSARTTSLEPPTPGSNQESVPLRTFVSHTGGPDGQEKNFAIRLHEALISEAKRLGYSYEVFIDREMEKCVFFPDHLVQKIENTDLGIVIVSEEFFQKKWPMIELMRFMELYMVPKPPKLRVLPVFYKLAPEAVRKHVEDEDWKKCWMEMSTERHPIDWEKCTKVVKTLCGMNGVQYIYGDRSHEDKFIGDIKKAVREIYVKIQRNPQGEAGPSSSSGLH